MNANYLWLALRGNKIVLLLVHIVTVGIWMITTCIYG